MLRDVSRLYDERSNRLLKWLEIAYEPLLVAFLGIFVGFTFISLLLPLVSLVQNLS